MATPRTPKLYDYLFGILQDGLWIAVAIAVPLMVVRWVRPEHLGLRGRAPAGRPSRACSCSSASTSSRRSTRQRSGLNDTDNKLLQDTGFGDTLAKDFVYAFLYPVAAPVAEELLFRGILFKACATGSAAKLRTRPGGRPRGRDLGGIFGAAHLGGGQDDFIPVLMALGVLLALSYEWSGTLYVPIVIHAVNNAIATGSTADPVDSWVKGRDLRWAADRARAGMADRPVRATAAERTAPDAATIHADDPAGLAAAVRTAVRAPAWRVSLR